MNIDSAVGLLFRITADDKDSARVLSELEKRSDKTTAKVSADFSRMASSVGNAISSIGSKVTSLGATLSVAVTAPLVAAGYSIGKFGLDVQALKNQLTAFEGSSEAAEARLASLRKLVDDTAGATRTMAYDVYGLLKPLKASDERIDQTIATLGRLKLGFKNLQPSDFAFNLTQIFGQGFELSDIKQAIGQVPNFREYLVKAFGTSDGETLKKMKESGKLTMDSFLQGFSEAVQNDPALAGLAEPTALRMQKFFEKSFEAIEPLANRIVEIIANLIELATPYLEQFAAWFKTISPFFQNIIIAVGAVAAALGPLLLVLGSAITFIGGVVSAIGVVSGAVAAVGGLLPAIGIAVLALIGLFIQITPFILAAAAAGYTLYKVWQTNFVGLRDTAIEVFTKVKEIVSSAMSFIYDTVQTVGGAVVNWWKENYPLIRQTVQTVSDAIKNIISQFLTAVNNFWTTHGERIKTFVSGLWNTIKLIVSGAMEFIGAGIRLAMQVINGDWEGAWNSVQKIVEIAAKNFVALWKQGNQNFINYLKALVPILIENFTRYLTVAVTWTTKIIGAVLYIWATLPQRLIELVPKFFSALREIGAAIWRGIREGWNQAEQTAPLTYGIGDVRRSDDTNIRPTEGIGDGSQTTTAPQVDTSALEKQRKEREDALKKQLAELSRYNQLEIESQRQKYEGINREWLKALEDGKVTYSVYQEQMLLATDLFQRKVGELMAKGFGLNSKGKKGQEFINEQKQYSLDLEKFAAEMNARREDIAKKAVETEKKQTEESIKLTIDAVEKKIEADKRKTTQNLANLDLELEQGYLKEKEYVTKTDDLRYKSAVYARSLYREILKENTLTAEQRADIEKKIADITAQIELDLTATAIKNAQLRKKGIEAEKQAAADLLEIKRRVAEEEIRLENFRRDQDRKQLENTVEFSRGKARIAALVELRNFEESEAQRKQKNILAEIEVERLAALEKIKGKENEEEQKFQIEELYKKRRLLSEEEFQQKLKEIRDGFNEQIGAVRPDGFLGGFLGGLSGEKLGQFDSSISFIKNAIQSLGNVAGQVFSGIANGIGQMVSSWVLLGNAGGQSLRKFTAQVLASVASQAAVLAVFELAKGFAALFFNPAEAAAHFTAAALFGSIALGTALIGRAIAGNSFQNNATSSFNQQSSGNGFSGSTSGSRSGGAYSGLSDQEIEVGRNAPSGGRETVLVIKDKSGMFEQLFEAAIENNSRVRRGILKLANG